MRSHSRMKLYLMMMALLFVRVKAQTCWCNSCDGEESTACGGRDNRMITSIFPLLQNQNRILHILFIRTADVTLPAYAFYNASLTSLQSISISQAPLHTIADGTFAGLSLEQLTLASNQLETFSVGILEGLNHTLLQTINIGNNRIQYLSSDLFPFFSNMPAGSIIDLGGNPLVCDCHLSWIFQLPTTVTIRNAVCMDPPSLRNMGLITETVSMRINETCPDICSTNLNDCPSGTNCSAGRHTVPFICICQPGVSDDINCVDIDECTTSMPCAPNEICINTRESYTCYNCTLTAIVNTTTSQCELCPQGFIANISNNYCEKCPMGTIVDTPNNTCLECPPGTITNITENFCQQCPPVSIVNHTNNLCQECPQRHVANISQNYCQACPIRSIVNISNNQCQKCHPGSIVNITGNYCQDCPLGSTVDVANNQCQDCPQGYVANVSANYCQKCPLGSIVNAFTNQCEECPHGFVANISENTCQECPIGSIVNVSNDQCERCPLGSIANSSGNYCQDCPVGSITNVTGNYCQECPLGSIVNIFDYQCQSCPLGFIANVASNYCQNCPLGSVANVTSNQCQDCPLRSIANISTNQCQECPVGFVVNVSENSCQECPLGSVVNVSINQCQRCPPGSIANITRNYCEQCPAGYVVDVVSNQCQQCPQGSIVNFTNNSCQACPIDTIVNTTNNLCLLCPPGSIVNITNNYCQQCPVGYAVDVVNNQCQQCPEGSIVNITNNSCQVCPIGTIANTTKNLCESCPPGSIANATANRCQLCPVGSVSNSTNNQCQACPNVSVADVVSNECLACPPGSIVNRTSNRCQSCPSGSVVDIVANRCQACPHRMIANITSNMCEECPQNSIANATSNTCQRCPNVSIVNTTNNQCQICPHGLVANTDDNNCESCPQGSHYNSETFQCQTCHGDSYFNSTTNLCQNCPEGLHFNTTIDECVRCPVDTQYYDTVSMLCAACPVGTEYSTATASCLACSDSGMTYNSSTQTCQFCPRYTQFEPSTEVCQPCARTAVYHESDHICFDCSISGMVPNNDQSMCASCEYGTVFNHSTKTCQSCPNMTEYNLESMACVTCPVNTQYNFTTRSCDECLTAKLYNGICVQCGPDQVVNNQTGHCEMCPGDLVFNAVTAECQCMCPVNMICFEGRFCTCPTGTANEDGQCISTSGVYCDAEVLDDTLWDTVKFNTSAVLLCPFTTNRLEMQSRLCNNNGMWSEVENSSCPSQDIVTLWESSSALGANTSETDLANFANMLNQSLWANPPTSGDLPLLQDLLNRSVAVFDNVQSREVAQSISEDIVSSLSVLFSHNSSMAWMNTANSTELLTSLTVTLDMLGSELVRFAENESFMIDATGIVLQVVAISPNSNKSINISLPSLDSPSGLSYIVLPPDIINNITVKNNGSTMCQLGVVSTAIEDLGSLLPPQGAYAVTPSPPSNPECGAQYMVPIGPPVINSVVLSSFIASPNCEVNTSVLNLPVLVTLQHDETQHGNPQCVFLDIENSAWSGDGCSVRERGPNYTICQCNHLTSFAIVMNPEGAEESNDHHLRVASKVGLALSIIALIASMLMLFGLGVKDSTFLYKIHGNLALALCLAQSVFLVGVDRVAVPSPNGLCILIAILLHYLLLATWAWMLVEGVHLYMMLVKIFYNRKIFYFYAVAAWSAPIIIVGITLGSRFEDYGTECFCWIDANNDNHGTIWSFHGPAIAILCINTFILIITMVNVVKVQRRVENTIVRSAFRATVVLLPVLGITWALGFLVVTTETETVDSIIEWLFFSFNTLQGVIFFILFCLSNRELRLAFLKKFGCRQVAIDIERDVSWTRRPSMQISSALQWARRASLMDSSRKNMRRDSNTSNNSDLGNPANMPLYHYNTRPSLLVSRLQDTLAEAEENSLDNFELNPTEITLLNVDPATGEVLRNPSPDQSQTDQLPDDAPGNY